MIRQTCPYLGLKEDPTTALGFPSGGNHCFKTQPNSTIITSHQQEFCLSPNHISCPIYRQSQIQPMPTELAYSETLKKDWRKVRIIGGVLGFLCVSSLVIAFLSSLGVFNNSDQGDLIPKTGYLQGTPGIGWYNFQTDATALTPFRPFQLTPSPSPTNPVCTPPAGWTTYTVSPTDSLVRLSIIFERSVQDLSRASCLAKDGVILPGQVIYVPVRPTNTPGQGLGFIFPRLFPTVTSTPRNITRPTQPPVSTSAPTSQPTATRQLPTATKQQPTATTLPPTPTRIPPTPTRIPPSPTAVPSRTPVPPTATTAPTITTQAPTATRRPTRRPTRPQPSPTSQPTQPQPSPAPTDVLPQPTAVPTEAPPQPTSAPTGSPPQPTDAPTPAPPPTFAPTDIPGKFFLFEILNWRE
jgi:hypothetical protein